MRKPLAIALAIVMFAIGAYSGAAAQTSRREVMFDQSIYLPELPQVGDDVEIDGMNRCQVTAVRRWWVTCSTPDPMVTSRTWRNLATANTYTVSPRQN